MWRLRPPETSSRANSVKKTLQGRNVASGLTVRVEFDRSVLAASPVAGAARDIYLAPGWIDLQVNGFAGVDYNDPATPRDEIARSIEVLFSTGVTRFYPTVITGPAEDMRAALENLADASDALAVGEAIDGFHVEGPYISPDDGPRGAHPREWVRAPDLDEFHRWQEAARGRIRIVTLAPERPGALAFIETVTRAGVVVSIGHSDATAAEIADAVSAGATMSTHLGNGAPPVMRRHPNLLWDQLADDRLAASFIVDGVHVPPAFLTVAIRAKGTTRCVLVTDATAPAGATPGRYSLGRQLVDLTADERVVLAGQDRLAGSALRMDHAVRNAIAMAGVTLADAVAMATVNPARVGGVAGRTGGLVAGDRADFVLFTLDRENRVFNIQATYMSGECVYRRRA